MPKKVEIVVLAVVDADGQYSVHDTDDVAYATEQFEKDHCRFNDTTGFRIYRLKTTVEAAEDIVDLVLVAEEIAHPSRKGGAA